REGRGSIPPQLHKSSHVFLRSIKAFMFQKVQRFLAEPLIEKVESLHDLFWGVTTQYFYRLYFGDIGSRSKIIRPLRLKNVHNIRIAQNVIIHKFAWLQTENAWKKSPRLIIREGCRIGNYSHLTSVDHLELEENVLLADRVFISDHGHEFRNPEMPIMFQGVTPSKPAIVGAGSWLGENTVVISSRIGRNCVIGANSVVLSDIPDWSVAVGAPARVVRKYNPSTGIWERTPKGPSI
ncbi:MAG: acyltransferase, partial [Limisphaerales bacterium]